VGWARGEKQTGRHPTLTGVSADQFSDMDLTRFKQDLGQP